MIGCPRKFDFTTNIRVYMKFENKFPREPRADNHLTIAMRMSRKLEREISPKVIDVYTEAILMHVLHF